MADEEKIGPTAHYTAYAWKRLGLPYAEHFATPRGAALFWSFRAAGEWVAALWPRLPTVEQYLALRHLAIDHALDALVPDLVIELGAGLSRRGVTWAGRGVRYIEVDLPHMIAAKRAAVARLPPGLREHLDGRLEHEPRSVLDNDFPPWLADVTRGASRPAIIAEGLMGYFEPPEQRFVARSAACALRGAGGGVFLCDLRAAAEGGTAVAHGARLLKAGIFLATRGRGARQDFASPGAIARFFAETGFDASEPLPPPPHLAHLRTPARVYLATARA